MFSHDMFVSYRRLPPDKQRGYSNVFNALVRIAREEGVATLWRVRRGVREGGAG